MKTDSRITKVLLLTLISMLTLGIGIMHLRAAEKEETKLEFSTQDIREMWWACSQKFRNLMPTVREQTIIYLCDCYTDHMRKTYTTEQVKALTKEQARILGESMKEKCPIPKAIIQT
jgi:hypothetical protein|tara:strand:- start:106 stop:456 length:351 start_codon:yes stop_codon:yes gene_type:complete